MRFDSPYFEQLGYLLNEKNARALTCLLNLDVLSKRYEQVPERGGVYVFHLDLSSYRLEQLQLDFELSGPGGRPIIQTWKNSLKSGMNVAYIGKSTNLRDRLSKHLRMGSTSQATSLRIIKPTSSCQYRAGFDHLFYRKDVDFRSEGLQMTYFNYVELDGDEHLFDRFYLETLAIGLGRPVFNVDGER